MKKLLSLLLSLTFTALWAQNVIYVNTNATGANNGSSWANARTNLSDALAAAQAGDEIWVAQGTYKPTRDSNHLPNTSRWATFRLKDSVKIYGGFTGSETQKSLRNHRQNPTILSGNIGSPATDTDNVYNVVYAVGNLSRQTRLDGFTITKGYAQNNEGSSASITNESCGAGIYSKGPLQVTFINLIIEDNYAGLGAAIYIAGDRGFASFNIVGTYQDDLHLVNCIIRNNTTSHNLGKAIVADYATLTVLNCLFVNNINSITPRSPQLYARWNAFVRVLNCTFLGDTVDGFWPSDRSTSVRGFTVDSMEVQNTILGRFYITSPIASCFTHFLQFNNWNYLPDSYGIQYNSVQAPYNNPNAPYFRPERTEPSVDSGNTASLPFDIYDFDEDGITNERIDFDLDNKPRIVGGQVDIGCYERQEYSVDTSYQYMCVNDSLLWGGVYRTSPGMYAQYFSANALQGDSVLRLALGHDSLNTSITLSHWGNDFTSDEADTGSTYQWLKCFTDEPIPGATSRTFTPTENGNYKVVITNSTGCIDTSECKALPNIGLAEHEALFSFYPNPVISILQIDCEKLKDTENCQIKVYNSRGELYLKKAYAELPGSFTLDMHDLPNGMYILQIGAERMQFVKE